MTTTGGPSGTSNQGIIHSAVIGPTGGFLETPDGKVRITFPAGAAREWLRVEYEELSPHVPADRRIVHRFALRAFAIDRAGAAVDQFGLPVERRVQFTWDEVRGLDARGLRLYTLNETTHRWEILPGELDLDARTVTGRADHFSENATQADPNVAGPGLVEAWQTDLHGGGATASYPIEVPPGPGGLKPRLTLSYTSGSADEMKNGMAASG